MEAQELLCFLINKWLLWVVIKSQCCWVSYKGKICKRRWLMNSAAVRHRNRSRLNRGDWAEKYTVFLHFLPNVKAKIHCLLTKVEQFSCFFVLIRHLGCGLRSLQQIKKSENTPADKYYFKHKQYLLLHQPPKWSVGVFQYFSIYW